jgi:2,3-bisphosphoglycerate-dependent phosphoglycerate mutase
MTRLVLMRHGQSQWNLENRFTGWVDVNLTDKGEAEARRAGTLLADAGFQPSIAYTSVLKRAVRTLWIALENIDRVWIPIVNDWRLNERHYGALTGLNKAETAEKHGDEQVKIWRRSYDIPPQPLATDSPLHPSQDARYAGLDPALLPDTESLSITLERVDLCFNEIIAPKLEAGHDTIISAHGNSLRALMMVLFSVSDVEIMKYEFPTGNPLMIELDGLRPVSAHYLDQDRANNLPPIPETP